VDAAFDANADSASSSLRSSLLLTWCPECPTNPRLLPRISRCRRFAIVTGERHYGVRAEDSSSSGSDSGSDSGSSSEDDDMEEDNDEPMGGSLRVYNFKYKT